MYDIVINDSVEMTKKRLPSVVAQGSDEDEDEDAESSCAVEGIIANDSIELTRTRVPSSKAQGSDEEDAESDFVVEGDSQFNADAFEVEAIFNIPTVIVTAPSNEDLMHETEQDVEYEYEDMLEDGELAWDLPGIIVTSPSDDDITSTVSPIVELDYMSIVDQGCKYFPLDGTLHNWNLRFNTGEVFPNHDLRGSGCIEAAGIQLLVSSPSDGDLWVENIIEKEFEVADILDHSYEHYLLDASLHNWSMRFNFQNYLRELQGSDDAPYDEDEVY
ncbi:hypothetical protein M378DRAFT_800740 [Amanita muscaria Koide BX008]|uniref:Uncharacterized protein n=1 Tax=Amanita muscaria (strain Koide BX008) TaxID=946122 RepID=A0A0C2WKT6_AMAMK|nr:hypothetical protein M378DRAFT_800740 [Amanita muscaria Koide BX008]